MKTTSGRVPNAPYWRCSDREARETVEILMRVRWELNYPPDWLDQAVEAMKAQTSVRSAVLAVSRLLPS